MSCHFEERSDEKSLLTWGNGYDWRARMNHYYVYIMSSTAGTLYIGMTNDLKRRAYEHKHKLVEGFSKKYNVTRLVYSEETGEVRAALEREKELKKWRRSKKIALIESLNPKWRDLSEDWDD